MKKIIALVISLTLVCSAAFSKSFFGNRFFEIRTGAEAGLSNNLITGGDIFQKELVIDLKKLADECPENGMNFIANARPNVEVNLNISKLHIGLNTGAEMYGKFEIGKDLFDFAGYGNSVGQELNLTFTAISDIFAYSQLDVGLDGRKFLSIQILTLMRFQEAEIFLILHFSTVMVLTLVLTLLCLSVNLSLLILICVFLLLLVISRRYLM